MKGDTKAEERHEAKLKLHKARRAGRHHRKEDYADSPVALERRL
jgi:hypothetical protein